MDWKLFLTVFGTVFLAEVGDKTQSATLLYAADAKHGKLTVFSAAALALIATTAIAVLAGDFVTRVMHPRLLAQIAGAAFIALGLWTFFRA